MAERREVATGRADVGRRLPAPLRRTFAALARVVCPDDLEALALERPVVDHVERSLGSLPPLVQAALAAGLAAFELGALALPSSRGRTFSALPPDGARRYFERWWHSPLGPPRQLAKALKALLVLAYWEHPTVRARLEYHPERWIAEVAARRLERYAAELGAHEAMVLERAPLVPAARLRRKGAGARGAA